MTSPGRTGPLSELGLPTRQESPCNSSAKSPRLGPRRLILVLTRGLADPGAPPNGSLASR